MLQEKGSKNAPKLLEILRYLWGNLKATGNHIHFILALIISFSSIILALMMPIYTQFYYKNLELQEYSYVQMLIEIFAITVLILLIANSLGQYAKEWVMSKLNRNLTVEMADQTLRLPLEVADSTHSSDLLQRATYDVTRMTRLLPLTVGDFVYQIVKLLFSVTIMFWIHWQVAILILLAIPPVLLGSHILHTRLKRIGREIAEQEAVVRQCQQEILQGMEVLRAYNLGQWIEGRFTKEKLLLNRLYMRSQMVQQITVFVSTSLTAIIMGMALLLIGWLALQGKVNIGALMAFYLLVWHTFLPLKELGKLWAEIQVNLGSASRTFGLIQAEKEISDESSLKHYSGKEKDVTFKDVCFTYQEYAGLQDIVEKNRNSETRHIYSLNLVIKDYEFVALVGPSGSGKSTIAKLAAGLLVATVGEVKINGVNPVRDVEWARQFVSYVPQSPYIFSGTVRDNLLLGKEDVSLEELYQATEATEAHQFILELPNGYDTLLSEQGIALSGGQRQRLAIARALLADRECWVLDEATSALDVETEQKVMRAVYNWSKERGRKLIVVAHRMATVIDADRIVVIENGEIQDIGTHAKLLEMKNKLYFELLGREVV